MVRWTRGLVHTPSLLPTGRPAQRVPRAANTAWIRRTLEPDGPNTAKTQSDQNPGGSDRRGYGASPNRSGYFAHVSCVSDRQFFLSKTIFYFFEQFLIGHCTRAWPIWSYPTRFPSCGIFVVGNAAVSHATSGTFCREQRAIWRGDPRPLRSCSGGCLIPIKK